MSQYLEHMQVGDAIDVKGPLGHFIYQGKGAYRHSGHPGEATHLNMIAGGTGITPMYQVIQVDPALAKPSNATWQGAVSQRAGSQMPGFAAACKKADSIHVCGRLVQMPASLKLSGRRTVYAHNSNCLASHVLICDCRLARLLGAMLHSYSIMIAASSAAQHSTAQHGTAQHRRMKKPGFISRNALTSAGCSACWSALAQLGQCCAGGAERPQRSDPHAPALRQPV